MTNIAEKLLITFIKGKTHNKHVYKFKVLKYDGVPFSQVIRILFFHLFSEILRIFTKMVKRGDFQKKYQNAIT